MHRHTLLAPPRIAHDCRLAHVAHLLDDVELAEPIEARRVAGAGGKFRRVQVAHVLHVAQPVVDQAERRVPRRRLHAAASVMAAHDDVLDPQHVDCVLQHGQAVQVRVHDNVGDVAMDEELAGEQADDLVGRHAAVRAPDPQILRRLLPGQRREELRVARPRMCRPASVVLEEIAQHRFSAPPRQLP
jgi:hypothetical protein